MMKRLVVFLLVLALIQLSCSLAPGNKSTPTPVPAADPMSLPWEERAIFTPGITQPQQQILDELPSATVYHLQFTLDADLTHLSGTEEVHYTNTETSPLNEVGFRLFPNLLGGELKIARARLDGSPITPVYSLNNSLMLISLPGPLEPGDSVNIGLDFSTTIPQTVDLNYGVLAYSDGVLALAHAYPMVPVYNDEGWNAEIPPQSGDLTFADMSFFIVRVTAPKDLVIAAVGREIDRSEDGATQTITYAAGPVRDFYLAASADYTTFTGKSGETTVTFYAPQKLQAGARQGVEDAVRALDDYSERYAPFPYTEFDMVSTPTLALGIEYPGMIALNQKIVVPGQDYLEGTVAHEVGHQWFYNLVGSDQLDQPWLDESLAQFATLQYFTDQYGPGGEQGFKQSLNERWARVDKAPIPIGQPVAAYTDIEYGAIVYGRGGLFFDALREQIGQDAFDGFLKDYTSTYSWKIATTEGLKSVAEKHCSCNLTPLFQEWVYP